MLLAEVCDHVKTPQLVSAWKGSVPVGKQAEAVIDTKETVSDAPPQGSASAGTAEGQVKTVSTRGLPGVFATRLEVSLKMPELLIFYERYSDQLEVSVDGRTVPVYTADALWASVRLPEGNHRVVLRKKPSSVPFALSASVSLGMICWGLLFFFRNGKKSEG